MNYYGATNLAASFRTVRKNTITIAEEIDGQHYGFSATPETRTIAQSFSHIALATRLPTHVHSERLTTLQGFDFMGFFGKLMAEEQAARDKQQIVAMLREDGDRFADWLEALSEDLLGESVAMPPGMTPASKSRFEMLLGVKEHEMHHRGQLMLLERMVGVVPHLTRQMQARIAEMQATQAGKASA